MSTDNHTEQIDGQLRAELWARQSQATTEDNVEPQESELVAICGVLAEALDDLCPDSNATAVMLDKICTMFRMTYCQQGTSEFSATLPPAELRTQFRQFVLNLFQGMAALALMLNEGVRIVEFSDEGLPITLPLASREPQQGE